MGPPPMPLELPPQLPPRIPRFKLWLTLLAPPFAGGLGMLVLACCKPADAMLTQLLLVGWLVVCLASLTGFLVLLAKRRFVTHITVLLILGYLAGEGMLSLAVFFGGCVLSL